MKILLINKFFYLKGGAERHFFDLGRLLEKKGHSVIFFSTELKENFKLKNKKELAKYSDLSQSEGFFKDIKKIIRIFWNGEAARKLKKLIEKEKPDVAHLHNVFGHLSPSIIFALKRHNIPIVFTLHDYKLFCPNYIFSKGRICFDCLKKKSYFFCLKYRCVRGKNANLLDNSFTRSLIAFFEAVWLKDILRVQNKIDMFVAPSLFMKQIALKWGIPEEKITHIPNFIFIDKFALSGYSAKTEEKYFFYFGRLSKGKGVGLLINAFKKFSKQKSGWKLKLAGDGPERNKLENLAGNYRNIEFLGKKNLEELKKLIKSAYAVILPSDWPENLPYCALETFALSKPIIASDAGGFVQLTGESENGILFKCGHKNDLLKKMIWAVKHPKEIKKMGENARESIEKNYNAGEYYSSIAKIYTKLQRKAAETDFSNRGPARIATQSVAGGRGRAKLRSNLGITDLKNLVSESFSLF